ncbi:cell wall-binding repeat-containing protein [Clostridium ljungdahlii]|uniref:N-acetylmuramoyl-L-alanine amidase LytC n=1 Tax=Clostridium ljungdahlii TaxID=1538 RepID=A0A168LQK6_9CLOT|nr:cell wall-binding repeat-containing protein [Clostridium ljungdahlii]OAA83561.1 N-acetylmuramoyl-L-alanine amidase LytC precursor [Clostridium ljungdahlii]
MKGKKLVAILAMVGLLGTLSVTVRADGKQYTTKRVGGQTRIETAVNIANNYSSNQLSAVIVTTANNFPEALVGSTLVSKLKAPILLVNQTAHDSQSTLDYIKTHLASNGTVYILGSTSSVSWDIESAIKYLGYTNIKRLAGTNEDETLKAITDEVGVSAGTPVFIASEDNFPDALSVSSISAIKGYPVILCSKGTLSDSDVQQLKKIKPSEVYIAGGTAAVSDAVVQQVASTTGLDSNKITRLYGQDRYGTSLAIAKFFNLDTKNAIIASGNNFPDALAGSSLALKNSAPIILVGNDTDRQRQYLDTTSIYSLTVLGGEGALTSSEVNAIVTGVQSQSSSSGSTGGTSSRQSSASSQGGGSTVSQPTQSSGGSSEGSTWRSHVHETHGGFDTDTTSHIHN